MGFCAAELLNLTRGFPTLSPLPGVELAVGVWDERWWLWVSWRSCVLEPAESPALTSSCCWEPSWGGFESGMVI